MSPQTFWGIVALGLGILVIILIIRDLIADYRRRRDSIFYFKCYECGCTGKVYRLSTLVTCHNCGRTFRPRNAPGDRG